MGRVFAVTLEGNIYSCKHCGTHLALTDHIVSKDPPIEVIGGVSFSFSSSFGKCIYQSFQSRHGKAYLFSKVVNVTLGEKEDRMMMTGAHTVVDLFCVQCGEIVGWKYEMAHEKSQKYKEGKSVLERYRISGPDGSNYWVSPETHVAGSSDTDDV